jgi:predicted nucleic acid-binding protein
VEVRSALERLLRTGNLGAQKRLDRLRKGWSELAPTEANRDEAEMLLARFPLSTADAMQLAAAMMWTGGHPRGRVFICGDARLLDAARQLGFRTIEA